MMDVMIPVMYCAYCEYCPSWSRSTLAGFFFAYGDEHVLVIRYICCPVIANIIEDL